MTKNKPKGIYEYKHPQTIINNNNNPLEYLEKETNSNFTAYAS